MKPSLGVSQLARGVWPLLPCPGAAKWGRGAIRPPKPPPLPPVLPQQQGGLLPVPRTLQLSVGTAELHVRGEGAPDMGAGAGQGRQQSPPMPWGRVLLRGVRVPPQKGEGRGSPCQPSQGEQTPILLKARWMGAFTALESSFYTRYLVSLIPVVLQL